MDKNTTIFVSYSHEDSAWKDLLFRHLRTLERANVANIWDIGQIDAGADFIQTQYCFDLDKVRRYCRGLVDGGFTEQAYFLIGIGPLASAKSARWMNDNLFGVHVPDAIIERLDGADDQRAEGRAICAELLQGFSEIEGCAGAHLMAPHGEAACAQVISESGLLEVRNSPA